MDIVLLVSLGSTEDVEILLSLTFKDLNAWDYSITFLHWTDTEFNLFTFTAIFFIIISLFLGNIISLISLPLLQNIPVSSFSDIYFPSLITLNHGDFPDFWWSALRILNFENLDLSHSLSPWFLHNFYPWLWFRGKR